ANTMSIVWPSGLARASCECRDGNDTADGFHFVHSLSPWLKGTPVAALLAVMVYTSVGTPSFVNEIVFICGDACSGAPVNFCRSSSARPSTMARTVNLPSWTSTMARLVYTVSTTPTPVNGYEHCSSSRCSPCLVV